MAGVKVQQCSTQGCADPAAFKTRTKPAWCTGCIGDLLRVGGLEPVEAFISPDAWWLTRCLDCGVQAHYKFEYVLEKNRVGEKTCRACFLWHWSADQHGHPQRENWSPERAVAHLDENGFDLAETIRGGHDPVVARCRACGNLTVKRMADVGFGCVCRRNTRSSNPAAARAGRMLLTGSDSAALSWWDHERNDEATLQTVTVRAVRQCHWICPDCDLRFTAKVVDMADRPSCPDCAARRDSEWRRQYERWKVTPVSDVPELVAAWIDDADPREVMVADGAPLRRFRCPNGHRPRIAPLTYLDSGCPHCLGARAEKRWLADTLPEIASQWHSERNGNLTPRNVVWDSKRTVWWRSDCCGHEWQATVRDRDKYKRLRCPHCETILGSLAWHDPGLAAEWSPDNPVTAWDVRPHATTGFIPEWICATDPTHVWRAPLSARSNGAECPECRVHGKSRVELEHYEAAKARFGTARSGIALRDRAFTTRKSWAADISVDIDGHPLVIEYDGAYWHAAAPKMLIDERKSRDLLAAGYAVVRLRENDLPSLAIHHHRYLEVRVYSSASRPQAVMDTIAEWVQGLPSR